MSKMLILLTLLFTPVAAFSAKVAVTVPDSILEPFDMLSGTIEILHSPKETIDNNSFVLEGKPLKVRFLKEEKQPDGTLLSLYNFEVTPEREGLNAVSPISVIVGGKPFQSMPATYTVTYKTPELGLGLRAFIYGKEPFYPGQRLKFVYKIYYRGDVKLTKEVLPLLNAKGFTKIGGLNEESSWFKGFRVSTFTQEVEATAPGNYSFGTSILEGIINGKKNVKTVVDPFTVTISPFPQKEKPASFTGAIGNFTVKARLISSSHVSIGDIIQLEIVFTGNGNLALIKLPELSCEPGLYGFFTPTATPPYATIKENSKTFTVELVPLSALEQKIPALTFSIFNPKTKKYEDIKTQPIPLTIASPPLPKIQRPPLKKAMPAAWEEEKVLFSNLPLQPSHPKRPQFKIGLQAFYISLLAAVCLWIVLYNCKTPLDAWRHRKRRETPWDHIRKASGYDMDSPEFYAHLFKAFQDDDRKKSKDFLDYLDQVKFGGIEAAKDEIIRRAKEALT